MSKDNGGNLESEDLLGATIKIVDYLSTSEEERIEEEKWHKQREKDEADARREARKNAKDDELPEQYPTLPKLPYPVPPDWDWRKAKREEERRAEEKRDKESEEGSLRESRPETASPVEK